MKTRIAVLKGGYSAEREVSLKSGEKVAEALRGRDYEVVEIDIGQDLPALLEKAEPDAVFIALHGRMGEDGSVQGLLEIMELPYVGSGVTASALALNKVISKRIFRDSGIPTPDFIICDHNSWLAKRSAVADSCAERLGFPCVVKPACEGSSIGMSFPGSMGELEEALDLAFSYDRNVLVEKFVSGMEITVGVLEGAGQDAVALPTLEVVPGNSHYDFEAKYTPGLSQHIIPARIENSQEDEVKQLALRAHQALECRDLSRVDFKLDAEGKAYVLEVNTLPGMTDISLFPEAASAMGIDFPSLVELLVKQALKRGNRGLGMAGKKASLLA